jgi:hypothetical protein
MILMVHIPKSGGQSLRDGLESIYEDGLLLHYNNPIKLSWDKRFRYELNKIVRSIRGPIPLTGKEIIFGHYCFDDFKGIDESMTVKRGAFFRDPVEWAGSFLLYVRWKHPICNSDHLIKELKKYRLHQGFSLYLGSIHVNDLDFVGITEDYSNSIRLFNEIFGKQIQEAHINKTVNAPKSYRDYFAEEGVLSEVENLMAENIDIYQQALQRYQKLCMIHHLPSPADI